MCSAKQAFRVAGYNFRQWKNPRIIITFAIGFVLCFLLSDKAIGVTYQYNTTMQIMEAFVWTFGDPTSILLTSLLLIILFADMPFISAGTPFYLVRTTRTVWLTGQIIYIVLATCLYIFFILLATVIISAPQSFIGNMWSETGAVLGYSGAGSDIALPASVKTMEMSYPYQCAANVFLLMLMYTLLLAMIMLAINLRKGQFWGVLAVFLFSLFGLFLNPDIFQQLLHLPEALFYKANVAVGWLSPLNQATYYMHNFGYDYLPRLWMTYAIFICLIALCVLSVRKSIRNYNFVFTGMDE